MILTGGHITVQYEHRLLATKYIVFEYLHCMHSFESYEGLNQRFPIFNPLRVPLLLHIYDFRIISRINNCTFTIPWGYFKCRYLLRLGPFSTIFIYLSVSCFYASSSQENSVGRLPWRFFAHYILSFVLYHKIAHDQLNLGSNNLKLIEILTEAPLRILSITVTLRAILKPWMSLANIIIRKQTQLFPYRLNQRGCNKVSMRRSLGRIGSTFLVTFHPSFPFLPADFRVLSCQCRE